MAIETVMCLLHGDSELQYDTVCLCALKSWRDDQLSLAHGTEKIRKNKNRVAQKKHCGQ